MTQQCYSKQRNLNHSKLQIKKETTRETRARKLTGKIRGRGGNGEFNYAKESTSKQRLNAQNKTPNNILIPIIIICPHFHNTTKIHL
jgi:hypothetical protein